MKVRFDLTGAAVALLSAWLFAAEPAGAATRTATPATIEAVLAQARGGDTIVLSAGVYLEVRVYNLHPVTPVTINASAATIRYMPFQNSSSFTLIGGAFGPSVYGTVTFLNSHDITAQGGAYSGAGTAAIAVTNSQHINLVSNTITGSRGDGVDIAASQYVLVQGNICLNNVPTPIHPDCVQMWSVIGRPQVSHITITGNQARGNTQGFDLFDHGTGGGSYIDIDHNVICTTHTWAGQVNSATNSTMTDNVAYTLPGAVFGFAPPTWQLTANQTDTSDGGNTHGDVFKSNANGAAPNQANTYPPCPVSAGSGVSLTSGGDAKAASLALGGRGGVHP